VLVLFLVVVAFYPFFEAWVTGDKREHNIADRPRNAPTRTAIGAAGVSFYAILWAAASSDLIATHFRVTIEDVIITLQVLFFAGPVIAFWITKKLALALQRKDREIVLHGFESSRIVRLPGGEYREIHTPLSDAERWSLVSYTEYEPVKLRPNAKGKITLTSRMRAAASRFYFEDRIAPVTKPELESQSHH
jgi:ubiquinol-cytochrome c reductase cytochrome b subunit